MGRGGYNGGSSTFTSEAMLYPIVPKNCVKGWASSSIVLEARWLGPEVAPNTGLCTKSIESSQFTRHLLNLSRSFVGLGLQQPACLSYHPSSLRLISWRSERKAAS